MSLLVPTFENTNSFTVFKQDGSHQFYCRWTTEEDNLLAKAVADHGPHKWTLVSKLIPGRTAVQCSTRWFGALNPNVHKGRWSKIEDEALTDAVRYFQMITPQDSSLPWNRIAENIPHRTGIQCQARWTEALDPAVRKGRWHPDEDKQLQVAIEKYGCCWIRVASMIPTRTQRQCRTRWNQIHSQQLKASNIRKLKPTKAKYEFMPSTFPNEASITIKQEEEPCVIIPADDDIMYSPASTRSSSFSSPTSSTLSMPNETSSHILVHDKELVDLFPMVPFFDDSISSLLNNSEFDFLLNCLENE